MVCVRFILKETLGLLLFFFFFASKEAHLLKQLCLGRNSTAVVAFLPSEMFIDHHQLRLITVFPLVQETSL